MIKIRPQALALGLSDVFDGYFVPDAEAGEVLWHQYAAGDEIATSQIAVLSRFVPQVLAACIA
jgi:hypothetical protein